MMVSWVDGVVAVKIPDSDCELLQCQRSGIAPDTSF